MPCVRYFNRRRSRNKGVFALLLLGCVHPEPNDGEGALLLLNRPQHTCREDGQGRRSSRLLRVAGCRRRDRRWGKRGRCLKHRHCLGMIINLAASNPPNTRQLRSQQQPTALYNQPGRKLTINRRCYEQTSSPPRTARAAAYKRRGARQPRDSERLRCRGAGQACQRRQGVSVLGAFATSADSPVSSKPPSPSSRRRRSLI